MRLRRRVRLIAAALAILVTMVPLFVSGASDRSPDPGPDRPTTPPTTAAQYAVTPPDVIVELVEIYIGEGEQRPAAPCDPPLPVLGSGRQDNPDWYVNGALFRPRNGTPFEEAVVILHDFGENYYHPALVQVAEGLARQGVLTLTFNLRRHDGDYLKSRFEWSREEIAKVVVFLAERHGAKRFFLVGHGFGSVEAVYYKLREPGSRAAAIGHYGPLPSPRGIPDPAQFLGMAPEEYATSIAEGSALVCGGMPRGYVFGPAHNEWAVEAGSLVDYFDPREAFATHAALVRSDVQRIFADGEDVVAGMMTLIADRAGFTRQASYTPYTPNNMPCSDQAVHTQLIDGRSAGVWLVGALFQHADPTLRGRRAVLTYHGSGGYFYDWVNFVLARCLAAEGYMVFSINGSGFGPRIGTWLFKEGVDDVRAAVDYLTIEAGATDVALHGHSVGSAVATHYLAATGDPRVNRLILTGTIDDIPEFRRSHVRLEVFEEVLRKAHAAINSGEPGRRLNLRWCERTPARPWCRDERSSVIGYEAASFRSHYGHYSKARPREDILKVQVPVLILRSRADMVTPCHYARRVFNNAAQARSVALVEIPDPDSDSRAGHALSGYLESTESPTGGSVYVAAKNAVLTWLRSDSLPIVLEPPLAGFRPPSVLWRGPAGSGGEPCVDWEDEEAT